MSTDEGFTKAMEHLRVVLRDAEALDAALSTIAETATESVPRCSAAILGLAVEGRPMTDPMAAHIALEVDLVGYDTLASPCLASLRATSELRLDIAQEEMVFPHFTRDPGPRGTDAALTVPARWGADVIGALRLYSRSGSFDESAASLAAALAAQVAVAISRSPAFVAARNVVEHGQRDLEDRADVSMATGLLMAREACTAEQASGLLRSAASADATDTSEIARRILRRHYHSR